MVMIMKMFYKNLYLLMLKFADDAKIIILVKRRKFQCQKVFALNINVFQERTFLIYFDIIPCFLYLGITLMTVQW